MDQVSHDAVNFRNNKWGH